MALKNIGILLALCATLAVSVGHEDKPEHGQYHGPNNPHYPARNRMESTNDETLLLKRHSSHHKLHSPHSSEESQENHEKWDIKNHDHSLHNPLISQHSDHPKRIEGDVARRRPLGFYPYGLYYPYYPHAYPSHNDEEFETIEAKARGIYHGPYKPHFPLNTDSSEESDEAISFPHWLFHHKPHFPLFHKPGQDKPEISSDEDDETSEESNSSQESYEDFDFPLWFFHHKPHFPLFHKPAPESSSDQHIETSDEPNDEGSGEEDIIPLSNNAANIPLLKNNDVTEGQNDEHGEDNDLKRFLETRKSVAVDCDALNTPRYSCYNCYNYLECKPQGGKIKQCKDPYAPYCNNGICSNTPGSECSKLNL